MSVTMLNTPVYILVSFLQPASTADELVTKNTDAINGLFITAFAVRQLGSDSGCVVSPYPG